MISDESHWFSEMFNLYDSDIGGNEHAVVLINSHWHLCYQMLAEDNEIFDFQKISHLIASYGYVPKISNKGSKDGTGT